LDQSGIEIVNDEEFLEKLSSCSASIIEATTVGVIPALLGMPLLLAQYGDLKSLSFGTIFSNYPRSYAVHDIADVSGILDMQLQKGDSDKPVLTDWIDLNVGPLPSTNMPERVVDIVDGLISMRGDSNVVRSSIR
jgi:hypothetical protein